MAPTPRFRSRLSYSGVVRRRFPSSGFWYVAPDSKARTMQMEICSAWLPVSPLPDVENGRPENAGSYRPPLLVKGGGELCDCFASWFGVDGECAWVLVSALGLEQDGGRSCFTEVGKRGVAELVECPPTTRFFEDGGGSFVGQSSPACVWAFVSPCWDDVGSAGSGRPRSLTSVGNHPKRRPNRQGGGH